MSAVYKIDEVEARKVLAGCSCAFGVFDGVHCGHRYLIESACGRAHEFGIASVVLTFDIDPDERFHPERLRKLLSNEDRIEMLAQLGVDAVVVLPFTEQFAGLAPCDFLEAVFAGNVPESLHVGSDIRFGVRAAGTVDTLCSWGISNGMQVCACDLLQVEGGPVTATRIRKLLEQGDVADAARLLTRPYTLHERVVAGRGEGRDMGFRTANLLVEPSRRVLREGVYAAYALVNDVAYKAAVSVGASPTFKGRTDAYCEVHILDFEGDIYGQDIQVQFMEWLRPLVDFASVDELIQTVMQNIAWVRENL
ncbi:MAG: riboflavin biosynthesis protein RibF [Eggerthellaceae bacterium]